ncbi:MAG: mycofactocin biosynthesis peptidyl-dipeptidase MftE [Acidimicrobiales bacterium]
MPDLGSSTWPEAAAAGRPLLVVPLGSTEQHGPHLPFDTDTRIATAVADGLAHRRPDVTVAPALAYGSSGEHAGFLGTLSIGRAATELVLVELVRSADAYAGVVLVSAHGGNAEPVARAVARLTSDGRRVLPWSATVAGGDAHAGRTETSLLLAIAPGLVRRDRAAAGTTEPLAELLPTLRAEGVRPVSPNGVLGDPAGANAEEGRVALERLIDDLDAAIESWVP